jgi:aspartate-semialdehyde dehydrogenase
MTSERIPVAVLGATGAVGQRFLSLLEGHPWFEVRELQASARSAGRRYREACEWLVPAPRPAAAELEVRELGEPLEAMLVFSALEAGVAGEAEERLARAGKLVVSNASAWRMDPRVPLIVPEVNAGHLELLEAQPWAGGIVTNPNCSTIGLALALAPLAQRFGLECVSVVSLQAISGAGTPTPQTLDLLATVVPHIPGEEEKLESETFKILGELVGTAGEGDLEVHPACFELGAQCNRVPVADGHTLCVVLELDGEFEREELLSAWRDFSATPQELELPLAPEPVVVVHEDEASPQPALHRDAGDGMAIHVGRLRQRNTRQWQFTTLSHNTVRGAAGGAILVAELALATGRL